MDPRQEVIILLKALKILRTQVHAALMDESISTNTLLDLLERSNNLNYCLENACWSIFGQRGSDKKKHLLDLKNDLG